MAQFIISTQPASQTVTAGQEATFTVEVSTDYTPLSSIAYEYQWYEEGETITDATLSSYNFTANVEDDGYEFFVTVSVLSGEIEPTDVFVTQLTSDSAILVVSTEPEPEPEPEPGSETFGLPAESVALIEANFGTVANFLRLRNQGQV
jgi:uncharacterized protein YcnI